MVPLTLVWALAGLAFPFHVGAWLSTAFEQAKVLSPASPDGCRVVALETSFLDTDGQIWAVPHGSLLPRGQASERYYTEQLGLAAGGRYTLTWAGNTATVTLTEAGDRTARTVTC